MNSFFFQFFFYKKTSYEDHKWKTSISIAYIYILRFKLHLLEHTPQTYHSSHSSTFSGILILFINNITKWSASLKKVITNWWRFLCYKIKSKKYFPLLYHLVIVSRSNICIFLQIVIKSFVFFFTDLKKF